MNKAKRGYTTNDEKIKTGADVLLDIVTDSIGKTQKDIDKLVDDIKNIDKSIKEAENTLADFGRRIEKLEADVAKLQGKAVK